MKYKTLRQRLKIYEIALNDYVDGKSEFLEFGFCWYFTYKYNFKGRDFYANFKNLLPELYETKPAKCPIWGWFEDGELPPRIACLKRAIKITENKIKKQEKTLAK